MTWWWLLGGVMGAVVAIALALRAVGASHWAAVVRRHTSQLESAGGDDARLTNYRRPASTRFDVKELDGLPAPVQRYFRAVLKDGQRPIADATIALTGTINMSATGTQWKRFTSTQRVVNSVAGSTAGLRPGFLWNASVAMFPGVPALVEDSYIAGQGQLIAKLFGLFTVARAGGGGELARGEFMRYFAESPWYPTVLLPSQGVQWRAVDNASANATIADGPITLTLLFRFNAAGLVTSVRAESRGAGVGKDLVMLPWDCRYGDYQPHCGMLIPMTGEAAWIRPEGRKAYFVGKCKTLHYEWVS
jgi:hypothetical protein